MLEGESICAAASTSIADDAVAVAVAVPLRAAERDGSRCLGYPHGMHGHRQKKGSLMGNGEETGQVTGTKDKLYNLVWFTEASLSNALRLETYIQDAEREGDQELADFFRRAQGESRKGGEQGKQLLAARLAQES